MLYTPKDYQRDAIDELKELIELYLNSDSSNRKEVVLKAPTGSGKTFIAATLFEELASENEDKNFCIMWACPGTGDLHKQSFDAVKEYLGGDPVCSLIEDEFFGSRKYIKNKEIVFVNWEKLVKKDRGSGKWANNLMRDQEGMNFINVLDQTKRNGTKIILVVDESHIGASGRTNIQEFINTIVCPNIVMEMSATPLNSHIDVEIDSDTVAKEGMIKESVIVNEGIDSKDVELENIDSETLILQKGYDKRKEIVNRYKELGININPLVLIQIPNTDAGEAKKMVVKDFLREKGITEENGKLKLWCDDKGNFDKKAIRKNNDITEYLIFKTAVATGWDCPRAHILIKFRETDSETFEIQTIGRILRTAEAKSYGDYLLDNAYMFTNVSSFITNNDSYNPNRIKTEFSKMRDGYTKESVKGQMQLISWYRSRKGDYNSADSRFNNIFLEEFKNFFDISDEDIVSYNVNIVDKLKAKGLYVDEDGEVRDRMLEETYLASSTIDNNQIVNGSSVNVLMSQNDIVAQYWNLIKENLNGLAYVRSKSAINSSIINALSIAYPFIPRSEKVNRFMSIVVNNKSIFSEILANATLKFNQLLQNNGDREWQHDYFEIEEYRSYSTETHTELLSVKSLYQPLFVLKNDNNDPDNQLETDFLNYLDRCNEVVWLWENGTELMKTNFGIPYNNKKNTFQPDFLVKFSNGDIGIFDTKPVTYRFEDTQIKSNALMKYIKDTNKNRGNAPKVIGGIVVKQGQHFYLFTGEDYHALTTNTNEWITFDDLLRRIETETQIIRNNNEL